MVRKATEICNSAIYIIVYAIIFTIGSIEIFGFGFWSISTSVLIYISSIVGFIDGIKPFKGDDENSISGVIFVAIFLVGINYVATIGLLSIFDPMIAWIVAGAIYLKSLIQIITYLITIALRRAKGR